METLPAHTQETGSSVKTGHVRWEKYDRVPGPNSIYEPYSWDWVRQDLPVASSFKTYYNSGGIRDRAYDYRREIIAVREETTRKYYNRLGDRPQSYGEWYDERTEESLRHYHGFNDFSFSGGETLENAVMNSIVSAYGNLADNRAQLGADIGELSTTLGMIADTATSIAKAIHAARVGNWGNVPRYLRMQKSQILSGEFPANKWLEYQYGWKPLYGTLHALTETYLKGLRKGGLKVKGTGRGKWSGEQKGPYGSIQYDYSYLGEVTTTLFGTVEFAGLVGLNSLGLLNPASIAWELLPFSFAIDWFIPVGAVLDTYTATLGLSFGGGYSSIRDGFNMTIEGIPKYGDWEHANGWHRTLDSGRFRYSGYRFVRRAYTNWPTVGFYANVQPFKSLTRVGNAAALVRQLLR